MEVIFYQVLSFNDFLPKLINKAWKNKERVCVFIKDSELLNNIDDLLWMQFPFLPHATSLDTNFTLKDQPVLLSHAGNDNDAQTIINVAGCVEQFLKAEKVIECFTFDQKDLLTTRRAQYESSVCWVQDGKGWLNE